MTRAQFILELTERLDKLSEKDREKALEYYLELIDDRIDDGIPEEEAVAAVGSLDEIAEQTSGDFSVSVPAKPALTERTHKRWITVLLIAGFPVWFSLLAAAFAIIISFCAGIFSVVVSLFATSVAAGVCAPAALLLGIQTLVSQGFAAALVYWGIALVCAGLAVFLWIGGHYTVKGSIRIAKGSWLWIQSSFLQKEDAK